MEFEWDEAKRLINLEKHKIDFIDVGEVWARPRLDHYVIESRHDERRVTAIGTINHDDRIVAVVYTMRNGVTRIISLRRARRYERKDYQNAFGRGT
ncbi:BrnT family toxin [Blastomonas sp.]|uniref:BrnT family toxin n=1 Tax=Blastomonas sp. TaxID=1909299 RepID=UPI00391DD440